MIPSPRNDITVTFRHDGHSWKVDIPACPPVLGVTAGGTTLPGLTAGQAFLADVKSYTGYLPHFGPPQSTGGPIPLVQTPSGR